MAKGKGVRLSQVQFFQLAEWMKVENAARRLDVEVEVLVARANKDCGFALSDEHIKRVAHLLGIKLHTPKRAIHPGNSTTIAAVGADLRSMGEIILDLMTQIGIEKTSALYQETQKLAATAGTRKAA